MIPRIHLELDPKRQSDWIVTWGCKPFRLPDQEAGVTAIPQGVQFQYTLCCGEVFGETRYCAEGSSTCVRFRSKTESMSGTLATLGELLDSIRACNYDPCALQDMDTEMRLEQQPPPIMPRKRVLEYQLLSRKRQMVAMPPPLY